MRPGRTVRLVRGPCSPGIGRQKSVPSGVIWKFCVRHDIVRMHRFDPTWATSVPFVVKFAQQGHNIPTSAQVEVHMASKWWTWPAQDEILKTPVFTCVSHFFCASMTLHVERVSVGPNLAQSCRQRAPKLCHVGHDLHLHASSITWLQVKVHPDWFGLSFSPNLRPTCPQCAVLDPKWAEVGPLFGPT